MEKSEENVMKKCIVNSIKISSHTGGGLMETEKVETARVDSSFKMLDFASNYFTLHISQET